MEPTLLLHPELRNLQLAFFYNEDDSEFYFRGNDAARSLGYANPSRSIRTLVEPEWIIEVDDGSARGNKVLYLSEAGFYQLAFSSTLEKAAIFRKWVFNDVLKSIRQRGYYLNPSATDEQFKSLKVEIEILELENQILLDNRELTSIVRDFLYSCVEYVPNKVLRSAEWQPAFKKWVQGRHGKEFYKQLNFSAKEVVAEMDRLFKLRPEPKSKRIHIDAKNGFGDLENAKLHPCITREVRSELASVFGYSDDIGE